MRQIILHVDMDAFYASVEMRDNPALRGKPLIIGSLPHERGVVATCSYEARKFGVHSAMNIKEAYRLCPTGIYMHPNFEKYRAVSHQLREIWNTYAAASETVALDEAYLDVTGRVESWEAACETAATAAATAIIISFFICFCFYFPRFNPECRCGIIYTRFLATRLPAGQVNYSAIGFTN